ncbi:MAG: serine/threonine protein kinase [Phycisphaeraceae bacterium]|nr:serine/threonine protein kinase [Phycisphaeraceae bacterium]
MSELSVQDVARLAREAARLDGAERDAFVRARCKGDEAALARVLEALRVHDAATIAPSPGARTVVPSDTERAEPPARPAVSAAGMPRRLGRYTILDVLGEGGMGVVYLAEQDSPKRTVALKVMRPGSLSSRMLRRFELESQVLGRLQHPGIAQVFEAGVFDTGSRRDDGRDAQPFFAMEHVRGVPLTTFALGQNPMGRPLSRRELLALFIEICDAVQHAHAKGVIHRDLKPANILVVDDPDALGRGRPKVLDFGVARATDGDIVAATLQTDVGQLVGTVPYMSPEQVAGDPNELDTRSDVYTLGVILYELLCGRLPHRLGDKTVPEAVRIINQDDPDPPSRVDRNLRGDLQTIILKSLEKDRARRYQSAADLAADVRRFLADEPISARPPTAMYQLSKFARRNKGLMGGLSVAAALLVIGVAGVSWQAVRATRGWDEAERRREEAETARAVARDEADNAMAVNQFLNDMLASADPENALGRDVTVREVLELSARSVGDMLSSRPRVHVSIRGTLSNTYRSIGDLDSAIEHARAGFESARAAFGEDSDVAIEAQRILINALSDRGGHEEAERLVRDVISRIERTKGAGSAEYALVHGELARLRLETGNIPEAVEIWTTWLPRVAQLLGHEHREALTMMNNLAIGLKDIGRYDESDELLRELIEIRERLHGRDHPQTLYALNSLAANMQRQGRNEEAEPLLRETLERRRRILGDDHVSTVVSAGNLGVTLISMGRLAEAEPLIAEALASYRRLLGGEHAKTLIMMANRAYLLEELGRGDEAEALYRETIEVRRRASGGRDPETWAPMNNLATLYHRRGKLAEADALFREVLDLCGGALPPGHPYTAIFTNNHADCLTDMGRYDEAEAKLLQSLQWIEAAFKPGHARWVRAVERIARLYEQWDKPESAAAYRARLAGR